MCVKFTIYPKLARHFLLWLYLFLKSAPSCHSASTYSQWKFQDIIWKGNIKVDYEPSMVEIYIWPMVGWLEIHSMGKK